MTEIKQAEIVTRKFYIDKIEQRWNDAVESIFDVGAMLYEAQQALLPYEWNEMIENELPFSRRTANRLIKIGTDPRLKQEEVFKCLPNSWGTIYEISAMDDENLHEAIEANVINTQATRASVTKFKNQSPESEKKVAKPDESLRVLSLYVDPKKVTEEAIQNIIQSIENETAGASWRIDANTEATEKAILLAKERRVELEKRIASNIVDAEAVKLSRPFIVLEKEKSALSKALKGVKKEIKVLETFRDSLAANNAMSFTYYGKEYSSHDEPLYQQFVDQRTEITAQLKACKNKLENLSATSSFTAKFGYSEKVIMDKLSPHEVCVLLGYPDALAL